MSEWPYVLHDLRDENGDPRADDLVGEFWPYDGPHSEWRTRTAVYAASRLVRYANNATQGGTENGPTIGAIVGSVSGILYGFDQLLDQLHDAAEHLADDPTLYDDREPALQGGQTARELAQALRELRGALTRVRGPLDRAHGLSNRLGHRS